MINKVCAVAISFFLGVLSAGPVLAVQPAQLMRSDELSEKQGQLMDQLRTSRAFLFNDYTFSGVDLSPEQSAALSKLIEPLRGNFLKKEEVNDLCGQVREYIHKDLNFSGRISCAISKGTLRIEYDRQ
jgi:hypothetical protein